MSSGWCGDGAGPLWLEALQPHWDNPNRAKPAAGVERFAGGARGTALAPPGGMTRRLQWIVSCLAASGCLLGPLPPADGGADPETDTPDASAATGGSANQACGYIEVIRRACQSSSFVHQISDHSICRDGWTDSECRARTPSKPDREEGSCYENYSFSARPFAGTCLQWQQYFDETKDASGRLLVQCLYDAHCPEAASGRCIDFHCVCDGPCPQPEPPAPGPR